MLSFICYPYNIHLYHWNDQSFKCKFEYDYRVSIHKMAPIKPQGHCGWLNDLNQPFRIRILFRTGITVRPQIHASAGPVQNSIQKTSKASDWVQSFWVHLVHFDPPFQIIIRNMRTYSSVLNQYQWPSSHWNYF